MSVTLRKFEVFKVENGWLITSEAYGRGPEGMGKAWIAHTPQELANMIVELVSEKPEK